MKISIIVAMASNRVIGRDNQIPWRLPGDLPRFKRITMGHPIIMGRKNHESIGRLLPGRKNIILTRQPDYHVDGAVVCHDFDEAIGRHCAGEEEIFIIGGADIYRMALPRTDRIYLTQIHEPIAGDVFFPAFDPGEYRETCRENVPEPIAHSYIVLDRR